MLEDTQKDVALKILNEELSIKPLEVTRFTTGYCHSVYYVKTATDEFVLRVTSEENKGFYYASVKWMRELAQLEIPVPKVLKHGQFEDAYYTFITYIEGRDIGEVYHTLNDFEKYDIVKSLAEIQRKMAALPSIGRYGYDGWSFDTWVEYVEFDVGRFRGGIEQNKVFDVSVCDEVEKVKNTLKDYFLSVKPTAFLDDITTKNVLVHNGKLTGIVDVDTVCYGDSLAVIGLTNMALLDMKVDTKYIDYWLDELQANETQRKVVTFYTLVSCIDFMSEQGSRFDNGTLIAVDQEKVEFLKSIYRSLLEKLKK